MRKKYYSPLTSILRLPLTALMAASGEQKPGGLTGNVDGTDNVIGTGGKDNTDTGMSGDAKKHTFSAWEDEL